MNGNSLLFTFFAAIFETVSGGWWFCLAVLVVDAALICGVFHYLKRRYPERRDDDGRDGKAADDGFRDREPVDGSSGELRASLALVLDILESVLDRLPDDDPETKRLKGMYAQASRIVPDPEVPVPNVADGNFMAAFEKLVRDNISNPNLDVRMLIEGMNMSRTVLFNKVKQFTGMNIQSYVNKCRMELAIGKMRDSNLPLAVIAEQSGFNSPRYFSTAFRNYTGMSPSQYKKQVIDAGKQYPD